MGSAMDGIDILCSPAGTGCDVDLTALEGTIKPGGVHSNRDIIPNVPSVHFHNPGLAYESGRETEPQIAPSPAIPASPQKVVNLHKSIIAERRASSRA